MFESFTNDSLSRLPTTCCCAIERRRNADVFNADVLTADNACLEDPLAADTTGKYMADEKWAVGCKKRGLGSTLGSVSGAIGHHTKAI